MGTVVKSDGTLVTDEMIEEWGQAWERGEPIGRTGPVQHGPPGTWSTEPPNTTETCGAWANALQLDADQRAKVESIAAKRHIPVLQVVRELIDAA